MVHAYTNDSLAERTTLRLGGSVRRLVEVETEDELVDAVRSLQADGEPLLVLGGGSNVVVADDDLEESVVLVRTRGIREESMSACGGALIGVAAGEPWDELVEYTISRRWSGLETLSGIPGLVGATPIQNVGAYGAEVAETVARVRVYDRTRDRVRTLFPFECGFGYRTSAFKRDPQRYVVLEVYYQLPWGDLSGPIRYAQLAEKLGVTTGVGGVPLADVRAAVLELRVSKGMVLDTEDHDTWSAGSFFTNPVVPMSEVPQDAPSWPAGDGQAKVSAAWLIEHAGFGRGYVGSGGGVGLSSKHTLALTNRGDGTTADLLALAREVRDGVRTRFGILLTNEPVLVGCTL